MDKASPKQKLVVDCDPGSDDTVALMAAFGSQRFEVLGVTTVFGNAAVEHTTDNALRILDALGETQVPVYRGAEVPWTKKILTFPESIHGKGGLGGGDLPEAKRKAEDASASSFIVDVCNRYPGEVSFLFCAPLTNLAEAIKSDPSLPSKWRQLAIMGGAFNGNGNINIHAEANIFSDAAAADYVFRHVRDVMVIGLDATLKCPLSSTDVKVMAKHSRLPQLEQIYSVSVEFYERERPWVGGTPPHDAIALMALLHKDLFEWKKGGIEVITEGIKEGRTRIVEGDRPINAVAMNADAQPILQYIKDAVMVHKERPKA